MNYIKATAASSIPIRPCPFCGSEAKFVIGHDPDRRGIQCSVCSACVPPLYGGEVVALG